MNEYYWKKLSVLSFCFLVILLSGCIQIPDSITSNPSTVTESNTSAPSTAHSPSETGPSTTTPTPETEVDNPTTTDYLRIENRAGEELDVTVQLIKDNTTAYNETITLPSREEIKLDEKREPDVEYTLKMSRKGEKVVDRSLPPSLALEVTLLPDGEVDFREIRV